MLYDVQYIHILAVKALKTLRFEQSGQESIRKSFGAFSL